MIPAALLGVLLAPGGSPVARAQEPDQEAGTPERIVLLEPEGQSVRPGLEPSMRIQLRDVVLVTHRVDLPPDVPSRLATASAIADELSADWVVWAEDVQTDPAVPADQAVLYVVGRRHGRALIEVVRVPGGKGPEVDRSLALKVNELISARDGAAYALGNKPPPPEPSEQHASEQHAGEQQASEQHASEQQVRLRIEAGAQLANEGSAGLTGDAFISVGPGLFTHAWLFAVPIEISIGLPRSDERGGNSVEWSEIGVAGWLKVLARLHPSWLLGGGIGGKLGFTDADGVSASGLSGSSTERLPAFLFSADTELALSRNFGAHLALGLEQRTQRQRFFIEGTEVANTGHSTLFARLSLVWHAW